MYVKQMIEERLESIKESEKGLLENVDRYERYLKESQSTLEEIRREKSYLESRLAIEKETEKLMTSTFKGATGGIFNGKMINPCELKVNGKAVSEAIHTLGIPRSIIKSQE